MSRQARVGILVLAGVALFLVALFAIASRSFLFSNTFSLKSKFENVAGLQAGAPVQYQGGSAGRVESVSFPNAAGGRFTVQMAIKDEVRHLVNERTIAQIKSQSLVGGGMMIVLKNPSSEELGTTAPGELKPVQPGGSIQGQEPFNISKTSDQLLGTVDTFATVAVELKQIMQDVQQGKGSLGRFIYDDALYDHSVATIEQAQASAAEAQRLMTHLSGSVEGITSSAEQATAGFQQVLSKVNQGEGTLGLLLNDESAYNRFLSAADTLVASTRRIDDVLANAESATQWASLGAYRFSENMEALKHNFLFKSYFEERGYMEKSDFEIRESALRATYEDLEERQRALDEREARLEAAEEAAEEAEPSATASPRLRPPADSPPADSPPADSPPADSASADSASADSAIGEAAPNEAAQEHLTPHANGPSAAAAPVPREALARPVPLPVPLPSPSATHETDR